MEEIILAQTGVDVNIKECPVFPDVHIDSCLSKASLSHSGGGGGGDQLLVPQRIFGELNILSVRERNMFDMVNLLWTFRSVQQRMILRDTHFIRAFAGYRWNFITDGKIPKLKCLSRDAVMLTLTVNNTQERQVAPLVNRLEGYITPQVREQLLTSYTGI